ncbi:MAG: class II fructose-bisphosphate aldolase [Oscillospiraceae bacterium]|nr:class II fructose-bisphosphate aldolase [Oscillospiraceae bacterium]
MPIVSMMEILEDAKKGGYAVGCFNCIDLATARGVLDAAVDENAPVILCHAQVHFKYSPLESVAPIMQSEASRARTAVALMLDHGEDFETAVRAMFCGVNAVMYDGSKLTYEENIRRTREVVNVAHAIDVAVEGEIGRIVRPVDAGADGHDDSSLVDDESLYTDPDEAADYVEKTGVDALACAFGTVHGVYRKAPRLDFDRLAAIALKAKAPIVMHGGSGLTEADVKEAIRNGVRKINYYTNMALYAGRRLKELLNSCEEPFYHNVTVWAREAIYEDARKAIRLFRN